MKTQIHALLTAEGMDDGKASRQSKRGRKRVRDALQERENGLAAQPLFNTLEGLEKSVKGIEEELRKRASGGRMVQLLMTIPGCGELCPRAIRAA
jgi:transposase